MRPVTVSTSGNGTSTAPVPLDVYLNPFNVTMQCIVTGVATYTVEWTNDDIWAAGWNPATANWFPAAANLVGATTSQVGTLTSPVTAVRCRQTAGAGSVQMRVTQSGAVG
jgi:hypothetical protein